jgi:hypothetical protein
MLLWEQLHFLELSLKQYRLVSYLLNLLDYLNPSCLSLYVHIHLYLHLRQATNVFHTTPVTLSWVVLKNEHVVVRTWNGRIKRMERATDPLRSSPPVNPHLEHGSGSSNWILKH